MCFFTVIMIINNDIMFKCSLLVLSLIDCDMKYLKGFIYIHSFILVVLVLLSCHTGTAKVGATKDIKHSSYDMYTYVIGMGD